MRPTCRKCLFFVGAARAQTLPGSCHRHPIPEPKDAGAFCGDGAWIPSDYGISNKRDHPWSFTNIVGAMREQHIAMMQCSGCDEWTPVAELHAASPDPEAPPLCTGCAFDALTGQGRRAHGGTPS